MKLTCPGACVALSLQTGNPFLAGSPSTLLCSERGSWPRERPSEAPLREWKLGAAA